jgi:hypothetical protein
MTYVNTHLGLRHRLRALGLIAVLLGACNGSDNLTSSSAPEAALDSVTTVAAADDSIDVEALAADSLAIDSLSQLTPAALMAEASIYAVHYAQVSRGPVYREHQPHRRQWHHQADQRRAFDEAPAHPEHDRWQSRSIQDWWQIRYSEMESSDEHVQHA